MEEGDARYRAVRLGRQQRSALLRAGIEDAQTADLIRVADPSMAVYLAEVLNALDRGEPLPSAGEQHYPVRFQLVHDATGLTSKVGVVYLHASKARMVVNAASDAVARTLAEILNRVGYPMDEGSWALWPTARPGRLVETIPELPVTTTVGGPPSGPRGRTAGYVLASVLPFALLLALLAVVRWPYALAAVLAYAAVYLAMQAALRRK